MSTRTSPQQRPSYALLIALTALSTLPVNIYLPALPEIAGELRADPALINLSVAGYAVATALVNLAAGALSDRIGRRPVALAALATFTLASIGCALAPNVYLFLIFRTLQASISACFAVAMVLIKETSEPGEATRRVSHASMAWAVAPMLAPTLGGLLNGQLGWRAIFALLAVAGAALFLLAAHGLHGTRSPAAQRPGMFAAYAGLIRSPLFLAYAFCMACSMGVFYVFLGGAPLVAGPQFALSSATLGILMGVTPAGFILGSYFSSRLSKSRSPFSLIIAGRLVTCVGLATGLALTLALDPSPWTFFGACLFIGVGNGLTMPAANVGVMSIRPELAGTATGLAAAMTMAGGALISASAGLFLAHGASVERLFVLLLAPSLLGLGAATAVWVMVRARSPR